MMSKAEIVRRLLEEATPGNAEKLATELITDEAELLKSWERTRAELSRMGIPHPETYNRESVSFLLAAWKVLPYQNWATFSNAWSCLIKRQVKLHLGSVKMEIFTKQIRQLLPNLIFGLVYESGKLNKTRLCKLVTDGIILDYKSHIYIEWPNLFRIFSSDEEARRRLIEFLAEYGSLKFAAILDRNRAADENFAKKLAGIPEELRSEIRNKEPEFREGKCVGFLRGLSTWDCPFIDRIDFQAGFIKGTWKPARGAKKRLIEELKAAGIRFMIGWGYFATENCEADVVDKVLQPFRAFHKLKED